MAFPKQWKIDMILRVYVAEAFVSRCYSRVLQCHAGMTVHAWIQRKVSHYNLFLNIVNLQKVHETR